EGHRRGVVAAHAGAHVLGFLVARLGDELRHCAALAALGVLGGGGGQQPAAVGRECAAGDAHAAAQVHRRRGLAGVFALPVLLLLALGLALFALGAQGFEQAHLVLAQLVGARRLGRVVLGLEHGGL